MEYIKPLNDDAYPERLGAYVNANPSLGIPGSTVPGEALQHTMTEIINAITAAGLTPDDTDLTQLAQAIKQLGTPIGSVLAYPIDDVPAHCLECNGAVISRETYPELFTVIGTTYGAGDGATTFKIPDLRGEFIRGWDHGRGLDGTLDRAIATIEEDSISVDDLTMTLSKSKGGTSSAMPVVNGGNNQEPFNANGSSSLYTAITSNAAFTSAGNETRPHNVAMMYCIVYE